MLDRNASVKTELAPAGATPTLDTLPRRLADFAHVGDALDYAAQGRRGLNFHDARGSLTQSLYLFASCARTRWSHARRFVALGIKPGDRVALVAETGAEFAACFFGAVYAGAWPVPLPLPTSFGGREAYVDQLGVQLKSCDPDAVPLPARARRLLRGGRRQRPASRRATGNRWRTSSRVCRRRFRGRARTTSPISNIRADRRASRTASPSRTTRFSTICVRTASASGVVDTDRCDLLAAVVPRHGPGRLLPVADRHADVGRLSEDRRFRAPSARLARHDHAQSGHERQLFADLRLRHLLAPHELADPRRGPVRPVALAHRRQWRRHDPPGRDAGVRRQLRAGRFQGQRILPQLRPRRSHARRVADASGRRHPARAGRGA